MRVMKIAPFLAVIILALVTGPALSILAPSAAFAQASNAGVFGLSEADWVEPGGANVQGDVIQIELDGGGILYVRMESGVTTSVTYDLGQPLAFGSAEEFVTGELLPSDAVFLGEYSDILPGGSAGEVTVLLYESSDLARFLPEYSGIVLFAWPEDGTMFSLSIGR